MPSTSMPRMPYVEEREFTLRFEVRCEFPEDYEGEEDGYEWFKAFPPVAAEAVRQVVAILQPPSRPTAVTTWRTASAASGGNALNHSYPSSSPS